MPETNEQFVARMNKSFEPLPEGVEPDWSCDSADTANDLMEAVGRIEDLEKLVKTQADLISTLTEAVKPERNPPAQSVSFKN